jgi:hypothetical protein
MILLPYLENGRLYTIGTCPKLLVNAIISSIPYTKTNANRKETGEDRTVLYDVPSSNVIELRGSPFSVTLSYTDINFLLEDNLDLCHEEGVSVLKWILLGYKKYCDRHPLRFKNDILGYMGYLFHVSNRDTYKRTLGTHIQRIRDPKQRKQGNDDVLMLRNLVAMEVPSIEVM